MALRALTIRRLPFEAAAFAVAAACVASIASIGISASTAASPASRSPSKVVCHTLAEGSKGDQYVFGRCSKGYATGGSARVDLGKLYGGGADVTFHWASGKVTEFKDTVQDELGDCGETPTLDAAYYITGPIVKDTTGVITAPVNVLICSQPSGWSLMQSAQI